MYSKVNSETSWKEYVLQPPLYLQGSHFGKPSLTLGSNPVLLAISNYPPNYYQNAMPGDIEDSHDKQTNTQINKQNTPELMRYDWFSIWIVKLTDIYIIFLSITFFLD